LKHHASSLPFTILLGALIALPALGTDFFVPALPALTEALAVPVSTGQLTLTTYFVGLTIGQIVWGPLSDRYGRKPVLFTGLAVMLVSSAAAAASASVTAIAAARLAQGIGMSSGALIGRTIVRDLYAHEDAARLLSRMMIVFSLVPMCAPVAGALLVGWAGWPSVFAGMALAAALLCVAITPLRETAPVERRSIHPLAIVRTFAAILGDRRFLAPYLLVLCSHIGVLAWVANSSFTLVRGLGVSALAYGLMFAGVMLGQITGAWLSSRLVRRLGIGRLVRAGTVVMMGAGIAGAALAWAGVTHWLAVVVPFMAFLLGTAIVFPNAMATALSPFPQSAGSASSLIGAIGFGAGALVSSGLGALYDGTARPIATTAAVAGIGAFLFERWLLRGKA
jgi:MFS transporter, DHA1 family, multidrug resistance protein